MSKQCKWGNGCYKKSTCGYRHPRCFQFLMGKQCSRCPALLHTFPTNITEATQPGLISTKPNTQHYVRFYCLACDQLLVPENSIEYIRHNRVWVRIQQTDYHNLFGVQFPQFEPRANSVENKIIQWKKYVHNADKGIQSEFIEIQCTKCKFIVGNVFRNMNKFEQKDEFDQTQEHWGHSIRINYYWGKTGKLVCYMKSSSGCRSLQEALNAHTAFASGAVASPKLDPKWTEDRQTQVMIATAHADPADINPAMLDGLHTLTAATSPTATNTWNKMHQATEIARQKRDIQQRQVELDEKLESSKPICAICFSTFEGTVYPFYLSDKCRHGRFCEECCIALYNPPGTSKFKYEFLCPIARSCKIAYPSTYQRTYI
jgi:hypothetical protein